MAQSETKSGGIGLAIIGMIVWIIHWIVTDVPRTSDASFFDGLIQGLSINVSALRRGFGADVGMRDYFAGVGYEIGLGLGVGMLVAAFDAFVDATVNRLFGDEKSEDIPMLLITVAIAAVGVGLGLAFAQHWTAPWTDPADVPPLMGIIPGRIWQSAMVISCHFMTAMVVLLGLATVATGFRKR